MLWVVALQVSGKLCHPGRGAGTQQLTGTSRLPTQKILKAVRPEKGIVGSHSGLEEQNWVGGSGVLYACTCAPDTQKYAGLCPAGALAALLTCPVIKECPTHHSRLEVTAQGEGPVYLIIVLPFLTLHQKHVWIHIFVHFIPPNPSK